MALFSSKNTCRRMKEVHPASIAVKHASFSSLSLNGIDEIMIVSIKSYFLSHKGRRPNVRRPNGRAPKRRRPNAGAQTPAPKRRRPNAGAQTSCSAASTFILLSSRDNEERRQVPTNTAWEEIMELRENSMPDPANPYPSKQSAWDRPLIERDKAEIRLLQGDDLVGSALSARLDAVASPHSADWLAFNNAQPSCVPLRWGGWPGRPS